MEKKSKKSATRPETSLLLLDSSPSVINWQTGSTSSMLMPVALSDEDQNLKDNPSESVSQLEQPIVPSSSSSSLAHQNIPESSGSSSIPAQVKHTRCSTPLASTDDMLTSWLTETSVHSVIDQSLQNNEVQSPSQASFNMHVTMPDVADDMSESLTSMHITENASDFDNKSYEPVETHWFYKEIVESKEIWYGFCPSDSAAIEEAYQKLLENPDQDIIVQTNGRRYDVDVKARERRAVYWEESINPVRRCSWFHKSEGVQRYLPYDETTAALIEPGYQSCIATDRWLQRLVLKDGEMIVFESPDTVLHYFHGLDVFLNVADTKLNPKLAFRGIPEGTVILPEEIQHVDHLLFVVQGIGSVCDLRFRTVAECVDGFREIANRLTMSHFKADVESGKIGRIEFLPLAWHASIHTDNVGLDKRMKSITLPSIPKLRHFTNDTLLDILLYSSPAYCETIINTVAGGLNHLYTLFMSRNPEFKGGVSVAGHSLGSLILFDILANPNVDDVDSEKSHEVLPTINAIEEQVVPEHQNVTNYSISNTNNETSVKDPVETMKSVFNLLGLAEYLNIFLAEEFDVDSLMFLNESELEHLGLPMGPRKKLAAYINHCRNLAKSSGSLPNNSPLLTSYSTTSLFPVNPVQAILSLTNSSRLRFKPSCFFALGSPISMFLAVRGFSAISKDFHFPTCPCFFNIFHPYDPVAFRIEPLIDPNFTTPPVVIPHHKGRKRMHIEIRENLSKMGSDLKQKVIETFKYTWAQLNTFTTRALPSSVETEVEKYVQEQINQDAYDENLVTCDTPEANIKIGCLNEGRRIDYVLQERPIEALNEYIFALTSHGSYWDSEDTVLMILKEVHALRGVTPTIEQDVENFYTTEKSFPDPSIPLVVPSVSEPSNIDMPYVTPYSATPETNVGPLSDHIHCSDTFGIPDVNARHLFIGADPSVESVDSIQAPQFIDLTLKVEPGHSVLTSQFVDPPVVFDSGHPVRAHQSISSSVATSVNTYELPQRIFPRSMTDTVHTRRPPIVPPYTYRSTYEASHRLCRAPVADSAHLTQTSLSVGPNSIACSSSFEASHRVRRAPVADSAHLIQTSQPVDPPSVADSTDPVRAPQPIGPPPLSGFIKKSPFSKS